MAEQKFSPMALTWGRAPNGRFFLNLDVPINGPGGQAMRIPVTGFLLTKDEEQSLRAALDGLVIAGNGHLPQHPLAE